MANEDQQMAWFPAPYLEEVALGQGRDRGKPLESSGMRLTLLPMSTTTTGQCAARLGDRKQLTQGRDAVEGLGGGSSPLACA